jgi:hypothetical protein
MPYVEDYMIDTSGLNYAKIGIDNDADVFDDFKGDQKRLLAFVQGGVMIKWMYAARKCESRCIEHSSFIAVKTTAQAHK